MNVTIHCYLLVPLLSCVINYNYVLYSLGGWSRHAPWIGAYLVFGQGWHAHGWAVPSATPPNGRGMADTH